MRGLAYYSLRLGQGNHKDRHYLDSSDKVRQLKRVSTFTKLYRKCAKV